MCRLARHLARLLLPPLMAGTGLVRAEPLREGGNILTLPAPAAQLLSVTVWVGAPATLFCDDWHWGVAAKACPGQAVRAIAVERAGSEVPTRLSAYQDLGEPRRAQVRWHGRGRPFELVLQGGEGPAAWEAVLGFSATVASEHPGITLPTGLNGRLLWRRVRHLQQPGRAWEDTCYGPPRGDPP